MKRMRMRVLGVIAVLAMALAMAVPVSADSTVKLNPGTYSGSGTGYDNGTITVNVVIDDSGKITGISTESKEAQSFWNAYNLESLYTKIIENNGTDGVDTISGATASSEGLLEAVNQALEKATAGFIKGDGSEDNPYVIASQAGLEYLQAQVAAGTSFAGQYITLSQDISLNGEWTPIGSSSAPFSGNFDGANHRIDGLTITGNTAFAGLFGYATSGACFRNIDLTNVNINTTGVSAVGYGGALVASLKNDTSGNTLTVIDHCFADGTVSVTTAAKSIMAGGLIGMSNQYAAIVNCGSDVNVTADSQSAVANVGGIVGMSSIKLLLMNNYASGIVTLQSSSATANAGGIAGTINGIAYNNVASGQVTGSDNVRKGGIAGNSASASYTAAGYYVQDTAFGNTSGKSDAETLMQKTSDEMATEDFAQLLHNNLSQTALSEAGDKVTAAAVAGCTDFNALMNRCNNEFYDWTLDAEANRVVLADELWASEDIDASIFAGGSGTKEDPYQIATEEQLRDFATSLTAKSEYEGVYIKLTEDITCSSGEWTPIGEGEYAFQGDFDGAGHHVSGITIGTKEQAYSQDGGQFYGFFGVTGEAANIHDLTIDANIYTTGGATIYTGGLAGYVEKSTIDHVIVTGNISGISGTTKESANDFTGGIGGMVYRAKIVNTEVSADVYAEAAGGLAEAGDIAGLNNRSLIANCMTTGKISGTADRNAEGMTALGGICGVHAGTMVNCVAANEIESETYSQYVGELSGWATGIAVLYDNYYSSDLTQKIGEQIVNPAVSIGWLVGPGVNDEGQPYSGGVEYQSTAFETKNIQTLAAKLNQTFSAFPVDMATDYSGITLNQWVASEDSIAPTGEAAAITYQAVEIPEEEVQLINGTFYGRDESKQLIVKLVIEDNLIKTAEAVTNETGYDLDALLKSVVASNGTSGLDATKDGAANVKEAVETALSKMEKGDGTAYGEVDPSIFSAGKGTKTSPYQIATEKQMVDFASSINEDETYEGTYIELSDDIQLTSEWIPAGTDSHYPFKGIFNGNGHWIKGLRIGTETEPANRIYAGLFVYLEGGTVKNLNIEAPEIYTQNSGSSRIYAGALAAFIDQKGSSAYVTGITVTNAKIQVNSASGAGYAAGLAASSQYGTITNCSVEADVKGISKNAWIYAGTLTGILARDGIFNNRVTGSVSASAPLNKAAIGGLAGFHSGVSFNNVADVTLTSTGTTGDIGALAGRNTGIAMMLDGYFNQEVTFTSGDSTVEVKGVGTAVEGSRDGKGKVENLTGLAKADLNSESAIESLNSNTDRNGESLKEAESLMENWNVELPDSVALMGWEAGEDLPQLTGETADARALKNQLAILSAKVELALYDMKVTAKATAYNKVTVSWAPNDAVSGYIVNGKEYGNDQNSVTLDAVTGETGSYTVQAYIMAAGQKVMLDERVVTVKAKPVLNKVTSVKAKAAKRAFTVTYKKVAGARGYVINYRTGSNKAKTIKTSKLTRKITKLKRGKTYRVKVRAYTTNSKGKVVYGAYSKTVKVKVK